MDRLPSKASENCISTTIKEVIWKYGNEIVVFIYIMLIGIMGGFHILLEELRTAMQFHYVELMHFQVKFASKPK